MQDSKTVLKNLTFDTQKEDFIFTRLYRLLYNKNLYYSAYSKLNKKEKNIPEEVKKTIEQLIQSLRDESYKPKKISINQNSLINPGFNLKDQLIEEVLKLILDAIYEPTFNNSSHGYRSNKSCHTALREINSNFFNSTYLISFTINDFKSFNNHILIQILRKRIKDERFIRLIWKFLKAGYFKQWHINRTFSGQPIGCPLNQILLNIYLNELDQFINKLEESENKLNYVRYAGSFLIGINKDFNFSRKIRNSIIKFLSEELKIKPESIEVKIKESDKTINFIGYNILISRTKNYLDQSKVKLKMPSCFKNEFLKKEKIIKNFNENPWKPLVKPELVNQSDLQILLYYKRKLNAVYDYYRLANNVSSQMNMIFYPMEKSCLKTLATKHKSSVAKIKSKLRTGSIWGIKIQNSDKNKIVSLKRSFKRNKKPLNNIDIIPN